MFRFFQIFKFLPDFQNFAQFSKFWPIFKILTHFQNFDILQWGESSPAKHGGAYFSAVVWPKILAITEKAIEKPHALHNSLRIHLARTFGATGKEQPSPPLHPAAAARLLSCRALRWWSSICLAPLVHISQFFANNISAEQHCNCTCLHLVFSAML